MILVTLRFLLYFLLQFGRGNDFRPDYLKCVELRSIFSKVPTIGLSATVTEQILENIKDILKLNTVTPVVCKLPDRPNIFLGIVHQNSDDFENDLLWVLEGIKAQQDKYPKTLIFGQTISIVSDIYEYFRCSLGDQSFFNKDKTDPKNRMISMYHGQISHNLQQFTLEYFKQHNTYLRILICTVAFGMGVEIPDIKQIIHWGRSKSILSFWQEIGRAGRNGDKCFTTWYPKSTVGVDKDVFDKLKNDQSICIRHTVLSKFLLPGMDTSMLKSMEKRLPCKNKCTQCICALCICCSHCKSTCGCNSDCM